MSKSFKKKQEDRKVSRDYLSLVHQLHMIKQAAREVITRHYSENLSMIPGDSPAIERLRAEVERSQFP